MELNRNELWQDILKRERELSDLTTRASAVRWELSLLMKTLVEISNANQFPSE